MLAQTEHKDIASFIMEYNREGAKVLSRYESSNAVSEEEGAYAVINDKHTKKVSVAMVTVCGMTASLMHRGHHQFVQLIQSTRN